MSGWGVIWGLIGVFGVGGTIALLFVFPAVLPIVLAFLRTKVGKVVAGLAFVAALILGAFIKGDRAGAQREREKVDAENAERVRRREEIERRNAGRSDGDIRDSLRREE